MEILRQMEIPDHLTYLLRDLYANQEATVRNTSGTTDWFKTGKGLHQGCGVSPCLFNLHAECIIRNTGRDASQAGIKITGRNINNFRYTDDTTLMAESEELKNLLLRVKEMSEKSGLELNIFIKEMMIILSYISVKIALKIIENHIEKLFYKLF